MSKPAEMFATPAVATTPETAMNFLREIVVPAKNNLPTEIDIVAVHGLNPTNSEHHAEMTWTKGSKMWLRDFLPQEIPTARVMLFGYNANVAFETSTAGVLEQAHNLLNRLYLKRRHGAAKTRPVIFIAHSLGGIVVKRALVVANTVNRYKSIREATHGIVFFGTPHRGGEGVLLGEVASKIVRAVLREPKNSFLESLKNDGPFSQTILEDFRTQLEDYNVITYYETRPLGNFGIIVNHQSAKLGLTPDREITVALDLDHKNICKFESQDDDAYEQVAGNIIEMVEVAIKNATYSEVSAPTSPDPMSPPVVEVYPTQSAPLLLPAPEDDPQGLDLSLPESSLEKLSMADPIAERKESSIYSESSDDNSRRQSNSTLSTTMTSVPSIGGSSTIQSRYIEQSPRLASSIKMNMKDTAGSRMREAAADGNKDLVKRLLSSGVPIDNSGVWDGYTALADAAVHGQEAVVELLLNEGANAAFKCIHSTSKFGSKENTPLALAAGKGHLGCMELLLDRHQYTTAELDDAFRAAKYKNRKDAITLIQSRGGGLY